LWSEVKQVEKKNRRKRKRQVLRKKLQRLAKGPKKKREHTRNVDEKRDKTQGDVKKGHSLTEEGPKD